MIEFQQDIKYQLTSDAQWLLTTDLAINESFSSEWYGVDKEKRLLWAKRGFAWDGATMFPDFDWVLEASLWHDILHLLIARGVIPESENNLIDQELANCVKILGAPTVRSRIKNLILSIRAWYVRVGTYLLDQRYTPSSPRPIYRLYYGKRSRIR